MNTVDLTPLRENEVQYSKIATEVAEKYKGSWDDTVHDSYGRYVKHVHEYADGVKTIKNKAEIILREVEGLKIPELISYAETLRQEAANV